MLDSGSYYILHIYNIGMAWDVAIRILPNAELKTEIQTIKNFLVIEDRMEAPKMSAPMPTSYGSAKNKSLHEYMKSMDKSFAYKLFDLIDERGMTDVECYKKANVSKQTWHKLMTDKHYKPNKKTAISFAIALELSLDETQKLLSSVGFVLSDSSLFDIIIKYCLENGIYDVFEINEALFEFDQVLLGC